MARKDSLIDHLGTIPLFAACSRKELQHVAKAASEIDVEAGRTLVEQGSVGREAFIITRGAAVVRRGGRKIADLGPGDYFGEMALLDKGPRTASVEAETDMTVLVLGAREFASVLDEIPSMARKLLKSLSQRIRDLDNKAFD